MKGKICFFLSGLLLLFMKGYGQWSGSSTPSNFIYRAGNVGIGVSSDAGYPLSVQASGGYVAYFSGNLTGESSPFPSQLSIHGNGVSSEARIGFSTLLASGQGGHTGVIKTMTPADGGGHMIFQTRE